jgi:hypothetical protein
VARTAAAPVPIGAVAVRAVWPCERTCIDTAPETLTRPRRCLLSCSLRVLTPLRLHGQLGRRCDILDGLLVSHWRFRQARVGTIIIQE